MNAKQWWLLVTQNWDNILAICRSYLPMSDRTDHEGNPTKHTVEEHMLHAFRTRNPILSKFLNEALWLIPDNKQSREIPGYSVLEQLVSEEPW